MFSNNVKGKTLRFKLRVLMLREFYVGEYFKENLRSVEFEGFVRISYHKSKRAVA